MLFRSPPSDPFEITINDGDKGGSLTPPSTGFPAYRHGHSTVMIDGTLYMYGGYTGFTNGYRASYTNSMDSYDLLSQKWDWQPAAPVGRAGHTGSEANGTLYFFGGRSADQVENTLEIFESKKESNPRIIYRAMHNYEEIKHAVTYKATLGLDLIEVSRKLKNQIGRAHV